MANIYIHIGTEKTGTKTIQSFLNMNRQNLMAQNIYVPNFLGWANRKITAIAFSSDSNDDFFISEGSITKDQKEDLIKNYIEEFEENAILYNGKDWVVSSEFMQSRFNAEDISRLKSLLQKYFDKIYVVIYIRDQLASAVSVWSTAVQSGLAWHNLPKPSEMDWQFNHQKTIERWKCEFCDGLIVKIFDKKDFYNGDLVEDYCKLLPIELNSSFNRPESQNESMSYAAIKLLSYINRDLPYIIDNQINPYRKNISEYVANCFKSFDNYRPSIAEIDSYNLFFAKSNEWVNLNYFKERKSLFRPFEAVNPLEGIKFDEEYLKSYAKLIVKIWKQ